MRLIALSIALLALSAGAARAQDDAGVPQTDAAAPPPHAAPDAAASASARTPPRLIEAPPVELPVDAEPLPPDAAIDLTIVVAADGTVAEAMIEVPLRDDVDARVLEAARAMRFEPATRGGAPVAARIRFRYRIAPPAPDPDAGTAPDSDRASADAGGGPGAGPDAQAGPDAGAAPGAGLDAQARSDAEGIARADREPARSRGADRDPRAEPASRAESEGDLGSDGSVFGARAVVDRPEPGATTRITLRGAELSTVPGTFGDPLRVIGSLPGVLRSPFGLPFFVVRGANFNSTGFMVDGFPVPVLYHFGLGPSVIPPQMVSRQRFYPGNWPVTYGRFSGGLVIVDTSAPDVDSTMVEASIDLLRASALISHPWRDANGRGALTLGFRRSYYELLLPLFVPGLQIQYTDYQVRAEYRWNSGFSASMFLLGSDDSLDQSGAIAGGVTSAGTNTFVNINFQRIISRLSWRLGEGSTLSVAGSVGRDGQFFGTDNVGQASQRFGLETYSTALRADLALQPLPWLSLNAGLDLAGTTTGIDITAPAPTGLGEYPRPVFDPQLIRLRATAARGSPGAYLEGVFRFDPLELSIGMRADILRYGTVTHVMPDPRAVARVRILPELVAKVGTGLFSEAPFAIQTISTGGNPRLAPSRAWQSSAGLEIDLPFEIDAEVNGYYSHMLQLPRFSQRLVPGEDGMLRREFFSADGEGRAYGLEVFVRRPIAEDFYAWISYTLSRSERVNTDGLWVPFAQDQEHTLRLVASYFIDGWRFGVNFQLATGRPTSEIRGGVYDSDANDYDAVNTGNLTRLPTYHQLDIRIDRDFDFGPEWTGTIYLEVLNVYFAQNAEGVIYQYDFQRSVPLPGIPILGTIGIRLRYL